MRADNASRWAALRALVEGEAASFERLGLVARLNAETIAMRAASEGWACAERCAPRDIMTRIGAVASRMMDEIEAMERAGAERFDKARIDALMGMVRAMEKLAELIQGGHVEQEAAQRSDVELADALERIEARIVELAHAYARELVAAKLCQTGAGEASR